MITLIQKSGWLRGGLIFFMPILLIFFLAAQMAHGQVRGRFAAYHEIPEVTELAQLQSIEPGTVIMLRGHIAGGSPSFAGHESGLLVYQERPAENREARYQEEFPLIFPELILQVPDGSVAIIPSPTEAQVIQGELHEAVTGDRRYTGFQASDLVTVQGQWQPQPSGSAALTEVTGITSATKAELMAEWQDSFQYVGWARDGLGLLTLGGLLLLVIEWRRARRQSKEENEAWPTPETNPTATIT